MIQIQVQNKDAIFDVNTSTYQRTNFTKKEILINHRAVLSSFGINTLDDETDCISV